LPYAPDKGKNISATAQDTLNKEAPDLATVWIGLPKLQRKDIARVILGLSDVHCH